MDLLPGSLPLFAVWTTWFNPLWMVAVGAAIAAVALIAAFYAIRLAAPKFVRIECGGKVEPADVSGNFVRLVSDKPLESAIVDQHTDYIRSLGARSVEFFVDVESSPTVSDKVFHSGMDLEKMLEGYVGEVSGDHPELVEEDLVDVGLDVLRSVH